MSLLQAILLGFIQGLTEFLPISSSGHLTLFQALFGLSHSEDYILFDLVCHLGTLLAIFCVYSSKIRDLIFKEQRLFFVLMIAILPLFPLVLIIKPLKALYQQPQYLGGFFIATALILYCGSRLRLSSQTTLSLDQMSFKTALAIGASQALAVAPGISRSGTTISVGKMIGLSAETALTFSFLLAIPTILGGSIYEVGSAYIKGHLWNTSISMSSFFSGFLTSFVVGYFTLKKLQQLAVKAEFRYFMWYCLIIGLFALYYFN